MRCILKALLATLMSLIPALPHPLFGADEATWTLDDFEDGDLKAASGNAWFPLADDVAGGTSEARLELRSGGTGASRNTLGFTGRLGGGGRAFAGAWVSLDHTGRTVNLEAFEGIRLRVKGPAKLQVGLRGGGINYMAGIEAGAEWRVVEVPFASLAPLGKVPDGTHWSAKALDTFGITTPQLPTDKAQAAGDVAFEVDDVMLYGPGKGHVEPIPAGVPAGIANVRLTAAAAIPTTGWIFLADDPAMDGNIPSLPDATRLEMIPAGADGILWFRVLLREAPHDRWMGMNIVLDVDGDPANGTAWWGKNAAFKFDRLVSVWCFNGAEGCQGFIGIADAEQIASGVFAAGGERLRIAIDRERRAFVVGGPRDALRLGASAVRLVGAVGSALLWNDDVPGEGAAILR